MFDGDFPRDADRAVVSRLYQQLLAAASGLPQDRLYVLVDPTIEDPLAHARRRGQAVALPLDRSRFLAEHCPYLLELGDRPAGYVLSHPWRYGSLPALNAPLGALPADADALKAAGAIGAVEVYPADHGWTVPDSPAYNKAQADRAYATFLAMLESVTNA